MPMNRSLYPADWKAISQRIRERAGNKCEWCGIANHLVILRRPRSAEYVIFDADEGGYRRPSGELIRDSELPSWTDAAQKFTRVVLSVAHLGAAHPDGTPGDKHDKMDNRDENLACLCQRCHLRYDMPEHVANRRKTMFRKRIARRRAADAEIGQLRMFD
jgi:hypothetical protein